MEGIGAKVKMKRKGIIVDLDGTLCNNEHRRHHVEKEKKDWDAFYAGIDNDERNEWCAKLVVAMDLMGYGTLFVTGRPEKYRDVTAEWLLRIGFPFGLDNMEHSRLLMRADGDFRQDSIVKTEIYKTKIEPHYGILFCIDDRKQVVDTWRALGLTCLQCAEGNF